MINITNTYYTLAASVFAILGLDSFFAFMGLGGDWVSGLTWFFMSAMCLLAMYLNRPFHASEKRFKNCGNICLSIQSKDNETEINVDFIGDYFSAKQVKSLVSAINEELKK